MFQTRLLLRVGLLGGLLAWLDMVVPENASAIDAPLPQRPNVLLLYADDLGWTDLSCQGSEYYETPHIDRLAADGMQFMQAYSAAANCAPSRGTLMTGCYTPRHGIFTVGDSDRGPAAHRKLIPAPNKQVLDERFVTLGELFQQAGYRTCIAGKWHLSPTPTKYGFGTNFGGNQAGHPKSYFSPYGNPDLSDGEPGEHLPARLSREVSDWLTQNAESPFFVYMPFYSVHTPIQARPELIEKYQKKSPQQDHSNPEYAAMIESMDDAVGKVLETLDRLQLTDKTLVVFASDNGPHGGASKASPLRGSKGMFYEGGIRIPWIVRFPGVVPAGKQSQQPVHQVDLYPTLARLIGMEFPDQPNDGIDILPAMCGKELPPRALYWHFPCYLQGYGRNNQGSRYQQHWRTTPCGVIREGDWKLIEYFEDAGEPHAVELYNLAVDAGETDDLADRQPETRDRLLQKLHAWQQQVAAPVPTERNPRYRPASPTLNRQPSPSAD